ncbi:hypothetical protein BST97_01850 [Nonlabens spongiae]|uniref:Histidine kinase n=1 Tax=Nonlabens spongiae TaxID=331648 RepID=A0A1W6MGW0_9FLAO|nr:2TM domain-containing protein [Nonlabens spongiae]ARN76841.1 hypothetical protein BST97_01850 [Nonlabens spongiae]
MTIKRFFEIVYASIGIAVGITLINFLFGNYKDGWESTLINFGINLMFSFSLTLVNNWFFHFMDRFYSWERDGMKRLIIGAIGSVFITMITLFLLLFITTVIIYDQTVSAFWDNQQYEWYMVGLLITLAITVIFHAIYFYKELQARKVSEQKVIARSAEAQFDALKNQLDPHFLFNSLNVLVSLIEENPKAATKFTTSLSKVYRYVLEQRNKETVAVDEELNFARTYVHLLKMRFEDSLEIEIPEQSQDPDALVVPLSLQLLLENAVKHNTVSDSKPLKIRIFETGGELVVENNLQPKSVVKKGSGVGLQNIASRYGLLTDRKMSIEKTDYQYKVQVPILNKDEINKSKNHNTMENYSVEDVKMVHARERVKELKGLYNNAFKSVAIILFLVTINFFTSDFPWAIFPAIGISIGLLMNYLRTTDQDVFLGRQWEERKIEEHIRQNSEGITATYQERYTAAKEQVGEIRGFYHHLLIYIVINAGIAYLNYFIDQWAFPWFLFPLGGWGLGVIGHAIGTFNLNPFLSKDWEERKIKEIVEKENNKL